MRTTGCHPQKQAGTGLHRRAGQHGLVLRAGWPPRVCQPGRRSEVQKTHSPMPGAEKSSYQYKAKACGTSCSSWTVGSPWRAVAPSSGHSASAMRVCSTAPAVRMPAPGQGAGLQGSSGVPSVTGLASGVFTACCGLGPKPLASASSCKAQQCISMKHGEHACTTAFKRGPHMPHAALHVARSTRLGTLIKGRHVAKLHAAARAGTGALSVACGPTLYHYAAC